jgi:hypothetical protein
MILSNNAYNIMKRVVTVVLPAISSLYFGLAQIWDLPAPEQVVGTIALITTFLGVLLGISSSQYNHSEQAYDGTVVVSPKPDGGTLYSLEMNEDVDKLKDMDSLRFRVSQQ